MAECVYPAPTRMTKKTTASLTATMTLLNEALSRMPLYSTHVTPAVMSTANRSKAEPVTEKSPVCGSYAQNGWSMPLPFNVPPHSCTNCAKCDDHDCATVAAPTPYSRHRSHPMIHPTTSPMVPRAYEYAEPALGLMAANSA